MTTNYEKYFGTLEKAAESLAHSKTIIGKFSAWYTPKPNDELFFKRGNGKQNRMYELFLEWLNEEAND